MERDSAESRLHAPASEVHMSFSMTSRVRRGIALSAVVLATGGLVLYRAPAAASPGDPGAAHVLANGKNSAAFAGPGVHGMISLSHTRLLAGQDTTVFADVRVVADVPTETSTLTVGRAPISLAVVLDTSGSMSGEKSKRPVARSSGSSPTCATTTRSRSSATRTRAS